MACVDAELAFSDGGAQRVVTFEPNDVVRQIQVRVVDDEIVESTENHSINLRVPEGETGVNLPQDSIIINVEDNDCEYRMRMCMSAQMYFHC